MSKFNKEIALEVSNEPLSIGMRRSWTNILHVNYKQHNPVIADGPSAIAKMIDPYWPNV